MERMVLRLFGLWTELQSLMKDYTLMALEGDQATEYADKGRYADDYILKHYKKIVRNVYGVAFPQFFSDMYNEAKRTRDKLAHLIGIHSITGERPHRIMTIIRTDGFEKYEDGIWLQHRYKEEIREEDLLEALHDVDEARKMVNIIWRLGAEFKELKPSNDDIWDFSWVPWWDGRWGPPPEDPEDYRAPVGRYRHHPEPDAERAYWDSDEHKWHRFRG